ncbi:MAG: lipopolysaccharide assembly protein LapA domain-containing protein [Spirochaetia bacterium]
MKIFKLASVLILAVLLVLLIFQNMTEVPIHFLWLSGELPAALLLFLTLAGGFIIGITAALILRRGKKTGKKREEN